MNKAKMEILSNFDDDGDVQLRVKCRKDKHCRGRSAAADKMLDRQSKRLENPFRSVAISESNWTETFKSLKALTNCTNNDKKITKHHLLLKCGKVPAVGKLLNFVFPQPRIKKDAYCIVLCICLLYELSMSSTRNRPGSHYFSVRCFDRHLVSHSRPHV